MPDNASFLIFRANESGHYPDRSNEIWVGPKPEPGSNIPYGCMAIAWVPANEDVNPNNYLRVNLSLIHDPQ